MVTERHISIQRSARYYLAGDPGAAIREVWFVCHGHGQLARDFITEFEPVASRERLIVAPEGLSRFYLSNDPGVHGPDAKVGATWMTREDREAEITDYVGYLDTLHEHVLASLPHSPVRVTALGFSQGGATASRWVMRGSGRVDRLVLWGSLLASDADLTAASDIFRRVQLTMVYGMRDEFGDPRMLSDYRDSLERQGVPFDVVTFAGGHRMDRDTLRSIASDPQRP